MPNCSQPGRALRPACRYTEACSSQASQNNPDDGTTGAVWVVGCDTRMPARLRSPLSDKLDRRPSSRPFCQSNEVATAAPFSVQASFSRHQQFSHSVQPSLTIRRPHCNHHLSLPLNWKRSSFCIHYHTCDRQFLAYVGAELPQSILSSH